MLNAREAVAAGASLLTAKVKDWRDRIDLETLDIQVCTSCILGQVFGIEAGADRGWTRFAAVVNDLGIGDAADYGFDAYSSDATMGEEGSYEELQDAWEDYLAEAPA